MHTLNGTAVTARAMIAILENFQDDGRLGRGAGGADGLRRADAARRRATPQVGRRRARRVTRRGHVSGGQLSNLLTFRSMRTTQRKGDIATSRAIAYFTSEGCDVSIPLTESAAYDIVRLRRQVRRAKCVRLAVRSRRGRNGISDQRLSCWSAIGNSSRDAQGWSGGRVRLIAAALKAAGPFTAGPGVRIPPAPSRATRQESRIRRPILKIQWPGSVQYPAS